MFLDLATEMITAHDIKNENNVLVNSSRRTNTLLIENDTEETNQQRLGCCSR